MKKKYQKVLAIETSCDDTSVAVVGNDGFVYSLATLNQDKDHEIFGGIVPEIASRSHSEALVPLVNIALDKANIDWTKIDGICVTSNPGLLGSLLVGIVSAKSLSMAYNKDLIGVNHLEGHLVAPFLRDSDYQPKDNFYPHIALAVSGGHTSLYQVKAFANYKLLGSSIDDAAGEAFDKFSKLLSLGFPGGPIVDKLAKGGNPKAFEFPSSLTTKGNLNFSFSGIKAAAQRLILSLEPKTIDESISDLCASYQEAIVDNLILKLDRAIKVSGMNKFIITGGVAANSRLQEKLNNYANAQGCEWQSPPLRYCTDNAAMIGYAGILRLNLGEKSSLSLSASSKSLLEYNV